MSLTTEAKARVLDEVAAFFAGKEAIAFADHEAECEAECEAEREAEIGNPTPVAIAQNNDPPSLA